MQNRKQTENRRGWDGMGEKAKKQHKNESKIRSTSSKGFRKGKCGKQVKHNGKK
jgi:hypothetical protein